MVGRDHKIGPVELTATEARQCQTTSVVTSVLGASLAFGAFPFFTMMLLIA